MPGVHNQTYICAQDGFRVGKKTNNTEVISKDGVIFNGGVNCVRKRFTTAQVNAGAPIVEGIEGKKLRLVDATLVAVGGGNASGATSVDIVSKQSDSTVKLVAGAVAGLEQNDYLNMFAAANVTLLDGGASLIANDAGEGISIAKTGSSLATVEHIDAIVSYVVED